MNDTEKIIAFETARPQNPSAVPAPEADPDIYEMTPEQLEAYLTELKRLRTALDSSEPEDIDSEEYEAWADEHEELEDFIDEVQERLDDLRR